MTQEQIDLLLKIKGFNISDRGHGDLSLEFERGGMSVEVDLVHDGDALNIYILKTGEDFENYRQVYASLRKNGEIEISHATDEVNMSTKPRTVKEWKALERLEAAIDFLKGYFKK